tara:strand:+ start:3940 stop:4698 length:759 start_codon:yes stop_codon:yes gene_type:complete
MDIKEQILVALGLNKDEVKLAWQGKSEDGTIFVSTAEELENGVDISVLTEDGTTIPLPVGTYKTDTGVSFRVEEEGIVGEVIESETEEKIEAKSEADEAYEKANFEDSENKEELAEEDKDDYDHEEGHDSEADVADWRGMEKRIKNLEIAVAKLKEDKMGGDDEVEEMSEETTEPSKNPKTIKTTEVVEFSAEDEIKKLKEENEKLKTELAQQPAESPLNTNKFSTTEKKVYSKKELARMSPSERFLLKLNK